MTSQLWQGFRLGDLVIDPVQGEVRAAHGSRHMPPKAAEVLLCLAARPGEIVPREELLESVWGPGKGSEEAVAAYESQISSLFESVDEMREHIRNYSEKNGGIRFWKPV